LRKRGTEEQKEPERRRPARNASSAEAPTATLLHAIPRHCSSRLRHIDIGPWWRSAPSYALLLCKSTAMSFHAIRAERPIILPTTTVEPAPALSQHARRRPEPRLSIARYDAAGDALPSTLLLPVVKVAPVRGSFSRLCPSALGGRFALAGIPPKADMPTASTRSGAPPSAAAEAHRRPIPRLPTALLRA
jgi:hypothetical protein